MDESVKKLISGRTLEYIQQNAMSQTMFAKHCGINPSYLSNILNGIFEYKAAEGKIVPISDKYFHIIADCIGMNLQESVWDIRATSQFTMMISTLENAHENAMSEIGRGAFKMIIGESDCGKTFAINQYCKAHPTDSIKITINDMDKIKDIIEEIGRQLSIELPLGAGNRLRAIAREFRSRALRGVKMILILDEGENTKIPGLKMYKAIYDLVQGYAAFVIAGTPELPKMMNLLLGKGTPGIKQVVRRFKAGIVNLPPMDRKYTPFMDLVEDIRLRKLLVGLCDNYGELHDFLEPAILSAKKDGKPLTEEYFRTMYCIAKTGE